MSDIRAQEMDSASPLGSIIRLVYENLDDFVKWPKEALLLWEGCVRIGKGHKYPERITSLAKTSRPEIYIDRRSNGPAISAYLFGKGERPKRIHLLTGWPIHHLYFREFVHPSSQKIIDAVNSGIHFTQSAGLVAIDPIAHSLSHEIPSFSWYLRERAYNLFGYDPEHVFGKNHDRYGFTEGRYLSSEQILYRKD